MTSLALTELIEFNVIQMEDDGKLVRIHMGTPSIEDYKDEKLLNDLKELSCYLEDDSKAKVAIFDGLSIELSYDFIPSTDYCRRWEKVLKQFARIPMITVAKVNGNCSRFSLQFALNCDYRIATESSAFVTPEIKEGYLPGMATFHLAKYVGIGMARRILLTGEPFKANQAFECGLVDLLCSNETIDFEVEQFAEKIAPVRLNVFQMGSRLLNESYSSSYETALGHFLAAQHKCLEEQLNKN